MVAQVYRADHGSFSWSLATYEILGDIEDDVSYMIS